MKHHCDVLVQCLKNECDGGRRIVNISSWYSWIAYDVIGKLMFSEDFNCLQSSTYRSWVTLILDNFKAGAWEAQINYYPRPIAAMLRRFVMPAALRTKFLQHGELTEEKLKKRIDTTPESQDIIGVLQRRKRENEVSLVHRYTWERMIVSSKFTRN